MAKKYRLINRYAASEANSNERNPEQTTRGAQYDNREILIVTPQKRHPIMWAFVSLVVVALIVLGAIWMNGVSTSLTHLSHAVNQNAASLAKQQSELAAIQTQLKTISVQLTQLQDDLRTFVSNLLQAIHHG